MRMHLTLLVLATLALTLLPAICFAEKGQIIGSVVGARSGIPVSVHPVILLQGTNTIARTLTDRLGKFELEFTYKPEEPLTIKTGSTTGYLEAQGAVEPNTEVAIKVMPRRATILGIVTDRDTGRGLADVPVHVGRGESLLPDNWASVKTDATGVFMLKVPAFDGDDVTKPVLDLWLSMNEGETGSLTHAQVRTDPLPLLAWPDPTQPTKVEVSLPAADATGLTVADVVAVTLPNVLRESTKPTPVAAPAPPVPAPAPAPAPAAAPATTAPTLTMPAATQPMITPGEFIWVCPKTGQKYKITIEPID